MQISENGLQFIKNFEGCSLTAYYDIAGKPTIGIGHLIKPGENFAAGLTEQQALDLLANDLVLVQTSVNSRAPQANQNQFNALCSFAFNLGDSVLVTMLSHGWDNVAAQIPRWTNAGGKPSAVLARRRAAEVELFGTAYMPECSVHRDVTRWHSPPFRALVV